MLPGMEAELAEELVKSFVKRGGTVMLGHGYKSMARKGSGWAVTVDAAGTAKTVEGEAVLIAVGRGPLSGNLGLEKAVVEIERGGFVKIDDSFRTTCQSIYAIGDVVRPPLLAHKASAEGIGAVEIMAGRRLARRCTTNALGG